MRDRFDRDHVGRPRREQHELVGKHDRFAGVVRDEEGSGRALLPHFEQELAQTVGGALVERDEGLVQQQEIGLGGEGAGERHAAREPEREFLGIARQHVGDADGVRQSLQILGPETRRRRPARCSAVTVRQGSSRGSWNMTPMRAPGGTSTSPTKRSSSPATMRKQCGLAAAGRSHQNRHALGLNFEDEVADGRHQRAVSADVSLLLDADFKPACYASVLNIVQGVAPANIRWPA